MSNRITERDVQAAADALKAQRIAEGKKTWLTVEYYNGWCHLHEVNAEMEARHCCIRKVAGGTKREMYQYLQAARF